MNQVSDDLLKAIEVLDSYGWTKGNIEEADGAVCLVGAVRKAIVGHTNFFQMLLPDKLRTISCTGALAQEISSESKFIEYGLDSSCCVAFNDGPQTTLEDVKLLLKRTAEKAEES